MGMEESEHGYLGIRKLEWGYGGTRTWEWNVLDCVGSLHGSQESIVEEGHEKALCQVVQVLTQCQDIVAFSSGGAVEPASLESGAETADGGTVVAQRHRLLENSCSIQ